MQIQTLNTIKRMKGFSFANSAKAYYSMLICIAFIQTNLFAQDIDSKIRAVFIYNIAKNINWPDTAPKGDFVIGVVGDNMIASELDKMTTSTTIGNGRHIVVKKIAASHAVGLIETYHLLYFSGKETPNMQPLANNSSTLPILIIGEKTDNSCKGSTLCFYKDSHNKIRLELHKLLLEERHLKATNDLVRLAMTVDN